jgi:hypothetical protein
VFEEGGLVDPGAAWVGPVVAVVGAVVGEVVDGVA